MFALLVATYFYLRQNFPQWPPPLAQLTGPLNPLPDLDFGSARYSSTSFEPHSYRHRLHFGATRISQENPNRIANLSGLCSGSRCPAIV